MATSRRELESEGRGLAAPSRPLGLWLAIGAVVALTHILFSLYDARHPGAFLDGDRAASRAAKIDAYAPAAGAPASLYDQGPPGDYVVHALLERLGGPGLVIAVQVLLTLASVLAAVGMAAQLGGTEWALAATGLLAFAAPGMLMNPHQLVTEPWSTVCVTLGCALCVDGVLSKTMRGLVLGFVCFAAASFFRPGTMLVPLVAGVALVVLSRTRLRTVAMLWLVSYGLFPGVWLVLRYGARHAFGLGPSDFDAERNFWMRAARVATPGDGFDPYIDLDKMPLGPFLSVMLQHPWGTVKTVLADAANLFLNSGTNQLFGHYLHIVSTPGDVWFFRNILDDRGPMAVMQAVWGLGIGFVTLFLVFTIPQLLVVATYILTPAIVRPAAGRTAQATLFVWAVAMASLVGVFAAGSVRWTQRSTVEPISAVLVVTVLGTPLARFQARRRRHDRPPRPIMLD